jgi:hypothetical protein
VQAAPTRLSHRRSRGHLPWCRAALSPSSSTASDASQSLEPHCCLAVLSSVASPGFPSSNSHRPSSPPLLVQVLSRPDSRATPKLPHPFVSCRNSEPLPPLHTELLVLTAPSHRHLQASSSSSQASTTLSFAIRPSTTMTTSESDDYGEHVLAGSIASLSYHCPPRL